MSAITAGWLVVGWGALLFETNRGLMQRSPSEIKEKLLKALDREYNVVDMAAVLEIVTILERTPITKEALETTRLGRDINELRRKTTNETLAKRAKDLVRRWRDLILPQSDASGGGGGGGGGGEVQHNGAGRNQISGRAAVGRAHPVSPAMSLPNSDKSSISPVLPTRGDAVPKTHAANKRLRKDVSSPGGGGGPDPTPRTRNETSPEFPPAKKSRPDIVVAAPAPPQQETGRRLNGDHYDSVGSDCEIVSVTQPAPKPKPKNRKKAPKDRTAKETVVSDDIVKEKIASISRTPKVKTTQELLADLKSRSGDAPSGNCVLPIDHDVARNKTEHIARFLRSQGDENDIVEVERVENETQSEVETETPTQCSSKEEKPVFQTAEEILSRLPPLDLDAIDWDESPPPSPSPKEVTEEDVDRVLNQHIEGLNGNRDERNQDGEVFSEWHEVVSRTSYQGTLLHILPYVVID